ncbi:hypothetical protein QAD02_018048 [Eretmocerus hayati]|uniref:Uncharacterized protein n=1 Tax=Eretmocerus hayati TaxID=131215 RepID=A0ACC2PHH0_9HYME|nr:hypothetical protein QAD02_018048 [Eretmocerus hayati]
MMQSDDESLRVDFDAICESSTKRPKLELVKEEVENTTSDISWVNTLQSETTESIGCREDEYYSVHKEVSQDMIDSALMIQPKEEPPLLEFEAIIQNAKPEMKVEPSKKDIDDLSPHCLDTELTCPCDEPSSLEPHDGNSSPSSTALFPKSFGAISKYEAYKMVNKHLCKSPKVIIQSLEKIRVESTDQFQSNGPHKSMEESSSCNAVLGVDTSDEGCLYWCLTSEVEKNHDLQILSRPDQEGDENPAEPHNIVSNWCSETIDDLASHKKAISRVNLSQKALTIPTIRSSNPEVLVDITIVKSDLVHINPDSDENNISSSNITTAAKSTSITGAHLNSRAKNRRTDSFFCLLWGRKRVWVLLRPEHEWTLQIKLYQMLSKMRSRPWKYGVRFPSHPGELLVKPAQLKSWGIPYEIVVQHPGDLLALNDLIVLYSLDAGPNIGMLVNIGRDSTDCAVNLNNGQKMSPGNLYMSRVVEAICSTFKFGESDKQPCNGVLLSQPNEPDPNKIRQQDHTCLCKGCDRYFKDLASLTQHMVFFHTSQSEEWLCLRCSKVFDRKELPIHHLTCKESLICSCGLANFQNRVEFDTHLLSCIGTTHVAGSSKKRKLGEVSPSIITKIAPAKRPKSKSLEAQAVSAMTSAVTSELSVLAADVALESLASPESTACTAAHANGSVPAEKETSSITKKIIDTKNVKPLTESKDPPEIVLNDCHEPDRPSTTNLPHTSQDPRTSIEKKENRCGKMLFKSVELSSEQNQEIHSVHTNPQRETCRRCLKSFASSYFHLHERICCVGVPRTCFCGRTNFRSNCGFESHQRSCKLIRDQNSCGDSNRVNTPSSLSKSCPKRPKSKLSDVSVTNNNYCAACGSVTPR